MICFRHFTLHTELVIVTIKALQLWFCPMPILDKVHSTKWRKT